MKSSRNPLSQFLRPMRLGGLVAVLALFVLGALAPARLFAAGTSTSTRGHDLILAIDARWAGCSQGGYFPFRIRATNTTRARALEFRYVGQAEGGARLPVVTRRVLLDQNSTQQFTLSVPMVSHGNLGELRVYEDGRLLEGLEQRLSLSDSAANQIDRPSLLVIHPSPGAVDCSRFEQGVQSLMLQAGAGSGATRWGGYPGVRTNDYQVVEPTLLPESWVDYTGVDVVAIPLATLDKLPSASQRAILNWTSAGGTLLVFDVGSAAADSKDLARILELETRRGASKQWTNAQPENHRRLSTIADPGNAGTGAYAMMPGMAPGAVVPGNAAAQNDLLTLANKSVWPVAGDTFSRRDLLAGRVFAFPGNPFPGSPVDWAWWLESADWRKSLNWGSRYGNSSRQAHQEFFQYLVPGVGAVPVVAFIALISLFAVFIGPLNYFFVWKRRQLYLLVLTIPLIALCTSLALFGYAMIADGFGVQSRLRSVTLLDQGTKSAVSFNRLSIYAGLAPSAGMQFSPETAVFPVWPDPTCFESGTIDWTETQDLQSGWLRSRTPAQFETISVRDERGRLEIGAHDPAANTLEVANGLEWPIDSLVLRGPTGELYSGRNLAPGAKQSLHLASEEDIKAMVEVLADDKPAAPPGAEGAQYSPYSPGARRMMYYANNGAVYSFNNSLLESYLDRARYPRDDRATRGVPQGAYVATLKQPPGIELGVSRTTPKQGVYVLVGFY